MRTSNEQVTENLDQDLEVLSLRPRTRGCNPTRSRLLDQSLQGTPTSDDKSKHRSSSFTIEAFSSNPKPFPLTKYRPVVQASSLRRYTLLIVFEEPPTSNSVRAYASLSLQPSQFTSESLPHDYMLVWGLEAWNIVCLDVSPLLNSAWLSYTIASWCLKLGSRLRYIFHYCPRRKYSHNLRFVVIASSAEKNVVEFRPCANTKTTFFKTLSWENRRQLKSKKGVWSYTIYSKLQETF